ncbi:hypothetical protein V6N11_076800 [Hibiscus sabdariffa]|uniref:Uncharacterized protein n=2 Tax=Hibiscus sabdariffa TaxID=183260 RepID=A0ABR2ATR8_9ROSI
MDNSSKKVEIEKARTPQKEERWNTQEGPSSSESQSPTMGGSQQSRGKARVQEDREIVGKEYETLAADTEKSKAEIMGLNGDKHSKKVTNWAELLFKNSLALKENGYGRAGEAGLVNTVL